MQEYKRTKLGRRIMVFMLKPCREDDHLECKRVIAGLTALLSCNCICHTNKKIRDAAIAFAPENHVEIETDDDKDDPSSTGGFAARCYTFWRSMV